MLLLQAATTVSPIWGLLKELNDPILSILLAVLLGIVVYLSKQLKAKDIHIKELTKELLQHTIKNVTAMKELEHSDDKTRMKLDILDILMRENNSFLQTILRSLNK